MPAYRCPSCGQTLRSEDEQPGACMRCTGRGTIHPGSGPGGEGGTVAVPPSGTSSVPVGDRSSRRGDDLEGLTSQLTPPQGPGELGRLGHYRILRLLRSGGMGLVFLAEDTTLHRQVAIKTMLPHLARQPAARQGFLREARAAAALEHDNVVPIHHIGADGDTPYIVMPLLRGQLLESRLRSPEPIPVALIVHVGRGVASALAEAHRRGLVHRDIKPANIWLEDPWGEPGRAEPARVKLLDFGLAHLTRPGAEEPLASVGTVLGTPGYMSPEQTQGDPLDGRSDLFSLGCVLYRMATGSSAFPGATPQARMLAAALRNPPAPTLCSPAIPRTLSDLVMRMLARRRDLRPASAEDVVRRLADIAAGLPGGSAAVTPDAGAPRPAPRAHVPETSQDALTREFPSATRRRRRVLAALAGLLLLGLPYGALVQPAPHAGETPGESLKARTDPGGRQADDQTARDHAPRPAQTSPRRAVPLSVHALVHEPARLPKVRSWSVEMTGSPGGRCCPLEDGTWVTSLDGVKGAVGIWNPEGRLEAVLPGHPAELSALAVSPDGKRIASASHGDNLLPAEVRVWDRHARRCLWRFPIPRLRVMALAFSPGGGRLAVGGENFQRWKVPGPLQILDLERQTSVELPGDSKWVDLAWSPAGRRLLCLDHAGALWVQKVWQDGISTERSLTGPRVARAAWSPDGRLVVVGLMDGKVVARMVRTWTARREIALPVKAPVRHFLWGSRGERLLVGVGSQTYAVHAKSGTLFSHPLIGCAGPMAWSADDQTVHLAAHDGLSVVHLRTGKRQVLRARPCSAVVPVDVALRPDGGEVLVGECCPGGSSPVSRFDPRAGELLGRWTHLSGAVLSWSGRGDCLAGCARGGKEVWLADSAGSRLGVLKPHSGEVLEAAWSPQDKLLATAGRFPSVCVWDAASREKKWDLEGQAGEIDTLAWSPDGRLLAGVATDGALRVWDVATGQVLSTARNVALLSRGTPGGGRNAPVWETDNRHLWVFGSGVGHLLNARTGRPVPGRRIVAYPEVGGLSLSPSRAWRAGLGSGLMCLGSAGQDTWHKPLPGLGERGVVWWGDSPRLLTVERRPSRLVGLDARTGRRLGALVPLVADAPGAGPHWLCVSPEGHWRGSKGVEEHLAYVVLHDDGTHGLYPPAQMEARFGWKNDPGKAWLLEPRP